MTTYKVSDEHTHCFYNATANKWCEYKFDLTIGMFNYVVYSDEGSLERGFIGLLALTEKEAAGWHFIGCL